VIARHYLDALEAVPDDREAAAIRAQAIGALIRAGERAERTGAPALAAASYATAAELAAETPGTGDGQPEAGRLWERAAQAADTGGDYAVAVEHAGRARGYHLQRGQARAAARAQATAGQALREWGHHAEARDELTASLRVLRADPDADTLRALGELAIVQAYACSAEADQLSAEALTLGQAVGVGAGQLNDYFQEAARLATQAGDTTRLGRALLNLSDVLAVTDPAAAAEAARTGAGHSRQVGARVHLAVTIVNLVIALVTLGDWDTAEAELTQDADSGALAEHDYFACQRAWLAALRGDAATAQILLAALPHLRGSEDPQDKALTSMVEAFTAAASHQPRDALRHARAALDHAGTIGVSHAWPRWAWPLAARTAHELGDAATVRELLTYLDSYQPGYLAPMLRAERDLARARLAASDGDPAAAAAFADAISSLRELSTPYHLAHGLLDHAQHLSRLGDTDAAEVAMGEARDIAGRLHCQPLLDRTADLTPAQPRVQT
jgi:hypothetical protein